MDTSNPLPPVSAAPTRATAGVAPLGCTSAPPAALDACQQFARRIQRLYSLPAAALQVIRLTSGNEADVRALTECLEADPALSTRILAVVNSSVYGLRDKVFDLNQAITLLGIKPLKLLVLGLSLPKDLLSLEDSDVLSSYWRHALVKSVAAREISRRFYHRKCEDEAFIAGLLQDLGLLALVQHLGPPYVRLLQLVHQQRAELTAAEQEALGFDHIALTAALLSQWGLPSSLIEYVRRKATNIPRGNESATQLVAQILHMAELCARILSGRTEGLSQLQTFGRTACGADEAALGQLLYELEGKVTPLAEALAIDTRDWPDLHELVDAAYTALARAAEEAAHEMIDQQTLRAVAQRAASVGEAVQARRPPAAPLASAASGPNRGESRRPAAAPPATAPPAAEPAVGEVQLRQQITAAVNWCRARRCPLSLLLVELIDFDAMLATHGLGAAREVAGLLRPAIEAAADGRFSIVPLSAARLAVLICDCHRQQALEFARQLLDNATAERGSRAALPSSPGHGLCVGVATLPMALRNFVAEDLEAAARRCLFAARQSGGGMIKSIDLI